MNPNDDLTGKDFCIKTIANLKNLKHKLKIQAQVSKAQIPDNP